MSKQNNSTSAADTLDQLAQMSALSSSPGGNTSIQERIAALLEAKLMKESLAELTQEEEAKSFREAQLASVKATMENTRLSQDACTHRKQNLQPAIGGQKDSKGDFHFICQFCQKEWGNELPSNLRIDSMMIGGPQF